jgi:hypothetical protein
VAKFLIEEILMRHGPPNKILSDQEREFMNNCIVKLCEIMNSEKSFTSAYHPQCNGAVQRLNRTLIAKLARICNGDWSNWDVKLLLAVYAYRICPITRLKASPFELLYGREANKMNRTLECLNLETLKKDESEIVEKTFQFRNNILEEARKNRVKEIERATLITVKNSNEKNSLEIGQIVMRRKQAFEKESKLDSKWTGPYQITRTFENEGYEIRSPEGKIYR